MQGDQVNVTKSQHIGVIFLERSSWVILLHGAWKYLTHFFVSLEESWKVTKLPDETSELTLADSCQMNFQLIKSRALYFRNNFFFVDYFVDSHLVTSLLPAAYEVRGNVMFSLCLSVHRRKGRVTLLTGPWSLVPGPFPQSPTLPPK